MLRRIFLYYQNKYLAILSIIFLTFLAWHKVLNQVFQGEGYMYFDPAQQFIDWHGLYGIWKYNNLARGLFDVFMPIFKDNIQSYQILMIVLMDGVYLSLYFVLEKITNSKIIAWATALFFALNYSASFTLLGIGNYQRFAERVPLFIPLVFSFYFLYLSFTKKSLLNYFLSLGLYSLAVFLGHFASLLLPLFFIFPFIELIDHKRSKKEIILRLLSAGLFVIVTSQIISHSDQPASSGLINFLLHEPNLIERTFYQIPMFMVPLDAFPLINKLFFDPHLHEPYTLLVHYATIICLGIYLIGFFLVFKNSRHLIVLFLTSFIAMVLCMFLYIYIDPRLNVLKNFGQDRYYFIPSLLAAISWAIILNSVSKKIVISRILTFLAVSAFVIYNTNTIWSNIDKIQYQSVELKRFIDYTISLSPQFNDQTILVTPSYLQWALPIITEFHSPKGLTVVGTDQWQNKLWPVKDNVFVIDYEFDKGIDKTTHPYAGHVVDFTQNYRKGEKIQFLN